MGNKIIRVGNENDSMKVMFPDVFNIKGCSFETRCIGGGHYEYYGEVQVSKHTRKITPNKDVTIFQECDKEEAEMLHVTYPEGGLFREGFYYIKKHTLRNMFWVDEGKIRLWDNTVVGIDYMAYDGKYTFVNIKAHYKAYKKITSCFKQ